MPDEITPQTADTSGGAPSQGSSSAPDQGSAAAASEDAVYETAFKENLAPEIATPQAPAPEQKAEDQGEPAKEESEESTPASSKVAITEADLQVLQRAGLDAEAVAGWSREKIDKFTSWARQQQSQLDEFGAKLGREKTKESDPAPKADEAEEQSELDKEIAATMADLEKVYDKDISPIGGLLSKVAAQNTKLRGELAERTATIKPMSDLLTEIVIDNLIDTVASDFPSAKTDEGRQKVLDRFWTEWNTGAYAGKGSMKSSMKAAMQNAAKVTFSNVTEASAAASLVKTNKDRVASQPRTSTSNAPPKPRSMDDVYDEEIGKLLGSTT